MIKLCPGSTGIDLCLCLKQIVDGLQVVEDNVCSLVRSEGNNRRVCGHDIVSIRQDTEDRCSPKYSAHLANCRQLCLCGSWWTLPLRNLGVGPGGSGTARTPGTEPYISKPSPNSDKIYGASSCNMFYVAFGESRGGE